MEPPRAPAPARQCLGWALLAAGRAAEAADAYHEVWFDDDDDGVGLLMRGGRHTLYCARFLNRFAVPCSNHHQNQTPSIEQTIKNQKDLARHPNNGFSLLGLWRAAEKGGGGDVAAARAAFEAAWAGAEVEIESSCPALARPFELP
jgi:hypothetical protein